VERDKNGEEEVSNLQRQTTQNVIRFLSQGHNEEFFMEVARSQPFVNLWHLVDVVCKQESVAV
jgi:hypothetical protein